MKTYIITGEFTGTFVHKVKANSVREAVELFHNGEGEELEEKGEGYEIFEVEEQKAVEEAAVVNVNEKVIGELIKVLGVMLPGELIESINFSTGKVFYKDKSGIRNSFLI